MTEKDREAPERVWVDLRTGGKMAVRSVPGRAPSFGTEYVRADLSSEKEKTKRNQSPVVDGREALAERMARLIDPGVFRLLELYGDDDMHAPIWRLQCDEARKAAGRILQTHTLLPLDWPDAEAVERALAAEHDAIGCDDPICCPKGWDDWDRSVMRAALLAAVGEEKGDTDG